MSYKYDTNEKQPIRDFLSNQWAVFNSNVHKYTEEELKKMLKVELKGRRRKSYVLRIHARLSTLRIEREKEELESKLSEE